MKSEKIIEEPASTSSGQLSGLNTAEIILTLRKKRGYTLIEIGELSSTPLNTVKSWSTGRFAPCESKRASLIAIFTNPNIKPSKRDRREMLDAHHLSWDKSKGWRFRFTLELNKKKVGKRVQQWLKTFDRKDAIMIRDGIINSYRIIGLDVVGRIQKPKAK